MKYTLITKNGKIYTFFILETAETYQLAYGGTIVTDAVVTETSAQF